MAVCALSFHTTTAFGPPPARAAAGTKIPVSSRAKVAAQPSRRCMRPSPVSSVPRHVLPTRVFAVHEGHKHRPYGNGRLRGDRALRPKGQSARFFAEGGEELVAE